ncbi:uncharacterized protein LOC133716711 [Rosa rugosa]|uniref:uncharacterized protein LOC133716711 n=1 Tax=Rosa rugosa TaxID=74645 RepID=UPI002B4116B7|nr:uncharacterized protein LOC133716711 [Rosa rugosa]
MEDELMNVKSTYYDSNGQDFVFEHCWQYLKNTEKFEKTPTMENTHFSVPNHVDLDDDETPKNEDELTSSRKERPKGQKAQKLAKKKVISRMRMTYEFKCRNVMNKQSASINKGNNSLKKVN